MGGNRWVRLGLHVLAGYLSCGIYPLWLGWRWLGRHRPGVRDFLVHVALAAATLCVSVPFSLAYVAHRRGHRTARTVYVRAHYRRRPRRYARSRRRRRR